MAYRWITFNGVTLPEYDAQRNQGTGAADMSVLDSIGGAFDAFGDRLRLPRKNRFDMRGKYMGDKRYLVDHDGNVIVDHAGNRIIAGSAANHLRGQVDALLSQIGRRGDLVRVRLDDESVRQARQCRLLDVQFPQNHEDRTNQAELTCVFETERIGWRDADATVKTDGYVNGVAEYLAVHNDGAYPVEDAVLTVARTSGTITSVQVAAAGIEITWTGSIGAGQTLTIDAGRQTVLLGDTDAYSGFALGSGHTIDGWLTLTPGANPLRITVVGGNADVTMRHFNQWP